MTLEEKIKELEKISAMLNSENTSLADGVSLYRKSLELTKECLDELAVYRGQITQIKREMDKLTEEPIEVE